MPSTAREVVLAFIGAINHRSPQEISDLMTDDHVFVDSAGTVATGRREMVSGWAEYFRMFPDYEILVDSLIVRTPRVAVFGRARGTYNGKRGLVPENRIEMPAAWQAIVAGDRICHWQVYADWTAGWRVIEQDRQAERTETSGR
jgi:predicted ester cyclase